MSEGKTPGKVVTHCHAGCTDHQVRSALWPTGTTMAANTNGHYAPPPLLDKRKPNPRPISVNHFDYCDENGAILYQIERKEYRDAPKQFTQRKPDGQGGWTYKLGDVRRVLYNLPQVIAADVVYVVEGERCADLLSALGAVATCNSGGAGKWLEGHSEALEGKVVVILPDNDQPGTEHAAKVCDGLAGRARSVKRIELPGLPAKGDIADWIDGGGTLRQLEAMVTAAPEITAANLKAMAKSPETEENGGLIGLIASEPLVSEIFHNDPEPVNIHLRPVPELSPELVPEPLRGWVHDIAERMACPLEYAAAPAIIGLAAVIGRKIGIRPKQRDDWAVLPNLWGGAIGSPGAKKSPAAAEAMKPLKRLIADALEVHKGDLENWNLEKQVHEMSADAAKVRAKAAAKKGSSKAELITMLQTEQGDFPDTPAERRYMVNDATVEKLGELLKENPNGLLVYRDELTGFIRTLDRQGHENDRSFYLEAWNGTGNYTYDRIGRGTVHIPNVCLSLFGSIQPAPMTSLLHGGATGKEADGFLSRFQMLVYPDPIPYKPVDRYPDTTAKNRAYEIYKKLDSMAAHDFGAEANSDDGEIPFIRFDNDSNDCNINQEYEILCTQGTAQEVANAWAYELETERLPSVTGTPLIEAHLSKYRSLMPKLALIFHCVSVADGATPGPVTLEATAMACAWCEFLEAHARRVYALAYDTPMDSALALRDKVKGGAIRALPSWDGVRFKVADVVRRHWASLDTTEAVDSAIAILEEHHWLQRIEIRNPEGGRPAEWIYVNPALEVRER